MRHQFNERISHRAREHFSSTSLTTRNVEPPRLNLQAFDDVIARITKKSRQEESEDKQSSRKNLQSRPKVRVRATAERALIEIEDECGGLSGENHDDLFRPFEQQSRDRTGLGIGLAFSRWAVEANHGRISVRNLPERGCVFTVDLPRLASPSARSMAAPPTRTTDAVHS